MRSVLVLVLYSGLIGLAGVKAEPREWSTAHGDDPLDLWSLNSTTQLSFREENLDISRACSDAVYAAWRYQTDLTEHNRIAAEEAQKQYVSMKRNSWLRLKAWKENLPVPLHVISEDIHQQFQDMSVLGIMALPDDDLEEYKSVLTSMRSIYTTASVCKYRNPHQCGLPIKGVKEVMRTSKDYGEILYTWKSWRDNTGKKVRKLYKRFVELENKAASYNGFDNMADLNFYQYDTSDFREELAEAWEQVKPLYQQLHAYARRKLREVYGPVIVRERGPIPAHLMGNMWAKRWNLDDLLVPYRWRLPINTTEQMIKQGYTPRKIFEVTEDFFTSLSMPKMSDNFWRKSIFKEPKNRDIVCQSSAWDFCNGYDFRIKQCAEVSIGNFVTAHREMSHVQYFLHYKDKPFVYRGGANPGFHEAIAGAVALSASTPKHLHRIGLLNRHYNNYAADVNDLMRKAQEEIAFLPFAYSMELWRWSVLEGSMKEKDWNCGWWDLRYKIQGLKPPVVRTEHDFDPASRFNLVANYPYDKHLVATIMQFQFYRALCEKAGEYSPDDPNKPLHKCDFYQSPEAGALLRNVMEMGASRSWREVMKAITGQSKLDASALREYFQDLEQWLTDNNQHNREYVGWKPDGEYCVYNESPPIRTACNE